MAGLNTSAPSLKHCPIMMLVQRFHLNSFMSTKMHHNPPKRQSGEHMQSSCNVSLLDVKHWSTVIKGNLFTRRGGAFSKRNLEMVSKASGTRTDRLTQRPPHVIKKDEAEVWHGEVYLFFRNVSKHSIMMDVQVFYRHFCSQIIKLMPVILCFGKKYTHLKD